MKFIHSIIKRIGFIACFSVGCLLGVILCNWSFFELDKKIGVFEIFSFIITSSLGFYIARIIQNRVSASRSEKDLIINEIKKILVSIDKLASYCNLNNYPFQDTKSLIRQINIEVRFAEKIAKQSTFCDDVEFEHSISSKITSLRSLITSEPPVGNSIILQTIQNNEVRMKIEELNLAVYKIIFKINSL